MSSTSLSMSALDKQLELSSKHAAYPTLMYVPFLKAMLEDANPLAEDETEARDALSALQEYVADGVENGIASRPLDAAQMDRIWHCWRTVMQTVAEAAASQRGLEPSAFIVDISEEATCACPDSSQSSPQEQRNTSQSKSKAVHEDKEAAAFRAQTLALAHRVTSAEVSIDLPTIDNHSAVLAKARAEVAQVRAARFQRKEDAKNARQERAAEEERKRNHRLNISAAKEKQETLKREVARQRVKAEKDASIRRKAGLEAAAGSKR